MTGDVHYRRVTTTAANIEVNLRHRPEGQTAEQYLLDRLTHACTQARRQPGFEAWERVFIEVDAQRRVLNERQGTPGQGAML